MLYYKKTDEKEKYHKENAKRGFVGGNNLMEFMRNAPLRDFSNV